MTNLLIGVFTDSKKAGNLVSRLKEMELGDNLSVVSKQQNEGLIDLNDNKLNVQNNNTEEKVTNGALIGGLLGLLVGTAAIMLPGSLLVTGPLATALIGLGGGMTIGALTGMLADMGVPSDRVKVYSERLEAGDVIVAIEVDEGDTEKVEEIMKEYNAVDYHNYSK